MSKELRFAIILFKVKARTEELRSHTARKRVTGPRCKSLGLAYIGIHLCIILLSYPSSTQAQCFVLYMHFQRVSLVSVFNAFEVDSRANVYARTGIANDSPKSCNIIGMSLPIRYRRQFRREFTQAALRRSEEPPPPSPMHILVWRKAFWYFSVNLRVFVF